MRVCDDHIKEMMGEITRRTAIEAELHEKLKANSEALDALQTLVATAPIGVTFIDPEKRYRLINDYLAEMNGFPAAAHIGHTIAQMVPGIASISEKLFQQVMDTNLPIIDYEIKGMTSRSPETERAWLSSWYPVRGRNGQRLGVGVVVREITERKRAQELQSLLSNIVESSNDAIISLRLDGTIFSWNPAAERMFNYRAAEVAEKTAAMLVPAERINEAAGFLDILKRGDNAVSAVETVLIRKGGAPIDVALSAFAIKDASGNVKGISAIIRDITERKRVENDLKQKGELLETIFDHIPVMLDLIDERGQIRFANRQWKESLGWSLEDAQDRDLFQEMFPDPDYRTVVMDYIRNPPKGFSDFQLRARDGHVVDTSWANVILSDGTSIGIGIDITERRRVEAERARLVDIIEATSDLVSVADRDERVCYMNQAGRRLVGYGANEDLSQTKIADYHPAWAYQIVSEQAIPSALRDGVWMGDTAMRTREGHEIPISQVIIAHEDRLGGNKLISTIARDISERRKAEEAQQEADRRKDEFLAMLSHELRGPLAPIRNAAQILKDLGLPDSRVQRAQAIIDRQVNHLARLVDDLLDVSRLIHGKIALQEKSLDCADLVASALEVSRPFIDSRRHELIVSLPPERLLIWGDELRLTQVIENLLNNAAKHTPEGGRIGLDVHAQDSQVVFCVRDTGEGIPQDLLPHVFDLFTQGDHGLDRSQGGLGVGLTIVKKLVELHGGQVEVRSANKPGAGSEFIVRLPLRSRAAATTLAGAVENEAGMPGEPKRILVVDDNSDFTNSLVDWLGLNGHEVKAAPDGPTALEVAGEFQPEIVLLDIGLPGMDGYEVARRLRASPPARTAFLCAVTGYGQQKDQARAEAAGFDDYLVKPLYPDELKKLLARCRPR